MKNLLAIVLAGGLLLATGGCATQTTERQVTETASEQQLSQTTTQPVTTSNDAPQTIESRTIEPTTNNSFNTRTATEKNVTTTDSASRFVAKTTDNIATTAPTTAKATTTKGFALEKTTTDEQSTDGAELDFYLICGGWESSAEGGSYYVFNKDKTFYWYKSATDLNDNYYSGTITVLKGYEAIRDLGLREAGLLELIVLSKGQVTSSDIYSLSLTPTYLVSDGIDKSDTLEDVVLKLLFIYIDESNAQGYNLNTGDTYYFIKNDKPLE